MDIFPPKEQGILVKYRKENFAEKLLNYTERRLIGKCPLTPEEVSQIITLSNPIRSRRKQVGCYFTSNWHIDFWSPSQ